MIEALLAAAIVISTLVLVNTYTVMPERDSGDDLEMLSLDILNVISYKDNSLEHPGLGFTLLSPEQWKKSSIALGADIGEMLPAGVYYYMATPYGTLGMRPADGSSVNSRPFIAYSSSENGSGQMLDCKLVLWRA
jgi:hypothetical protein